MAPRRLTRLAPEEEKSGDSSDVEALGQGRLLLDVDLTTIIIIIKDFCDRYFAKMKLPSQ